MVSLDCDCVSQPLSVMWPGDNGGCVIVSVIRVVNIATNCDKFMAPPGQIVKLLTSMSSFTV